ncbi:mannose-6-phosphate isomerase [Aricia agestis]|uniref:mannose-6-phosphate isomerase n=1 Tax=Aricia agestis TaxID=91739 RepID=UPI001C206C54|nr:mannose-6-phosphate isomerase [Aricia agestis]XP_041989113.1 mannose-6-phosphate isomerase [Aricia agestis]
MELCCKVQNYEWGKMGTESKVAQLISSANPNLDIDATKPYAELWMGTHPNGPSMIVERGKLISEYLNDNHDAVGKDVKKHFGVTVPFLLKILSVRKALSIQAHPTKKHAEELHKKFPEMYKDPNHKPELAIALTRFEALCGFRPLEEIEKYLDYVPELKSILPSDIVSSFDDKNIDSEKKIKKLFNSLMTSDKSAVEMGLKNLLLRLENEGPEIQALLLYPVLQQLHKDYPGDVGCWAPYFINYITLQPGQAIFLKPNLIHAYLSGDCVECMACSDNVVRAGLTPKHMDVPTLVEMLDYKSYTPQDLLFNPELEDPNCCIWRPPVPDFAVIRIRVESGDSYNTIVRHSPSIIIVTSGSGEACDTEPLKARPGLVLFLKASRQLTLTPEENSHIEAYQAICNV